MGDAAESYDLPVPTVLKPVELWTGKQIFSAMVRPNAATRYSLLCFIHCGDVSVTCGVYVTWVLFACPPDVALSVRHCYSRWGL